VAGENELKSRSKEQDHPGGRVYAAQSGIRGRHREGKYAAAFVKKTRSSSEFHGTRSKREKDRVRSLEKHGSTPGTLVGNEQKRADSEIINVQLLDGEVKPIKLKLRKR
jgi:hypothetical protein